MNTPACATALAGLSSTKQSSSGSVDLHGAHFRGWNKYAGTYPAKISTVVLIFADGAQMDLMHHWQPCFRTVSAILIVLSTVVAKDAISSFHVQSDPSTDSLSSISLLGWLKTCPEDLAKHAGAFLLMAARVSLFFFIFSVSQPGLLALEG